MQNIRIKIMVLAAALGVVLFLKNCVAWKEALPMGEEPTTSEAPTDEVSPDAASPVLQ